MDERQSVLQSMLYACEIQPMNYDEVFRKVYTKKVCQPKDVQFPMHEWHQHVKSIKRIIP